MTSVETNHTSYKYFLAKKSIIHLDWEVHSGIGLRNIMDIKPQVSLKSLMLLDVSNNNIQVINKNIGVCSSLVKLHFSKNPITHISSEGMGKLLKLSEIKSDW